jgi:hypothetical protein
MHAPEIFEVKALLTATQSKAGPRPATCTCNCKAAAAPTPAQLAVPWSLSSKRRHCWKQAEAGIFR